MIKTIEIENIKGIGSGQEAKIFALDIIPNKPSLIVAPNGFGKSSFSTAFNSLNKNRIKLDKDDFHKQDEQNKPIIRLKFQKPDKTVIDLLADENSNTISDYFDYFVINNQVKAKGVGQNFAGRTNVSASLNIEPIILIENIPHQIDIKYSYNTFKTNFEKIGKILPNLNSIFSCLGLFVELQKTENLTILDRTKNKGEVIRVDCFKQRVNQQTQNISKQDIITYIRNNELNYLIETYYLNQLQIIVKKFDLNFQLDKEIESFLVALQLIELYHSDKQHFKDFCKRKEYESDKENYKKLFKDFNSTWLDFRPKEKENSLILEFPKAHLISNGQRDVLCFMALLEKAKKKLTRQNSILIIDEVFDYLDDANLVAVQYYTTQFINEYKSKYIYLLILTHLDPLYFKGYVFGRKHKLKLYYLSKKQPIINEHLTKILKERNNPASAVKTDIEKYLLHFHTTKINKRQDFQSLNLKETWGELDNFDNYIFEEARKYCNDEQDFDPLAVCCAVRKKIEQNIYNLIIEAEHKHIFLNEKISGTNEKLEFAEEKGITVNETYYFLGIIYNEALHWKDDRDKNSNTAPAMYKLENLTIKQLIKTVFQ